LAASLGALSTYPLLPPQGPTREKKQIIIKTQRSHASEGRPMANTKCPTPTPTRAGESRLIEKIRNPPFCNRKKPPAVRKRQKAKRRDREKKERN
jgi:hypothetical protein